MSYGRNPHYIWSDGEELRFDSVSVPEYLINAFLYKLLLKNRREELRSRLREGKEQWMTQENFNIEALTLDTTPQDDYYIQWMDSQEDDILKQLMSE